MSGPTAIDSAVETIGMWRRNPALSSQQFARNVRELVLALLEEGRGRGRLSADVCREIVAAMRAPNRERGLARKLADKHRVSRETIYHVLRRSENCEI